MEVIPCKTLSAPSSIILFIAFFHVLAVGTLADLIEKRSRL